MIGKRTKRKPMAEINVVPYIDVMLVLLVIFMVTAPLLYQGVQIDLPQASAKPMPRENIEPLIVEVNAKGEYFLSVGDDPAKPVDPHKMQVTVAAVLRNKPKTPVMVRGDRNVPYGDVVTAMTLLQKAGAPQVSLITQPPPDGH